MQVYEANCAKKCIYPLVFNLCKYNQCFCNYQKILNYFKIYQKIILKYM